MYAGGAAGLTGLPHCSQKEAPGTLTNPQDAHPDPEAGAGAGAAGAAALICMPQFSQKPAPGALNAPQLAH